MGAQFWRISGVALLALAAVGLSGTVEARDAASTSEGLQVRGRTVSVDPRKSRLTIEQAGTDLTRGNTQFHVDAGTQISDGRQQFKLEDLQPGRQVEIAYILQGDARMARTIILNLETGIGAGEPQATDRESPIVVSPHAS